MIGLLRFVFAILVWPFTSHAPSCRDCGAPSAGDCPTAEEPRQSSAEQRRSMVLRPALSHVSFDLAGRSHIIRPETLVRWHRAGFRSAQPWGKSLAERPPTIRFFEDRGLA